MKALVTGASSGIGKDIAIYLDKLGYELFIVGRNKNNLDEVAKACNNIKAVFELDLSNIGNVYKLYEKLKNEKIDILINNAGFGLFGYFNETDLVLNYWTRYYLYDFIRLHGGIIPND